MGDSPKTEGLPRRILSYPPPAADEPPLDPSEEPSKPVDPQSLQASSSFLDKADRLTNQRNKYQTVPKGMEISWFGDPPTPRIQKTNIAYFGDHNRAYFHWNEARLQGKIKQGAVLLHFDTHDDMQFQRWGHTLPPTGEEASLEAYNHFAETLGIASYIAPAVYEGSVSEIYWILPDWAPRESTRGKSFWNDEASFKALMNKCSSAQAEVWHRLLGQERDVVFYVASFAKAEIYFSPVPPDNQDGLFREVRKITVHKVYKEELPDFKDEKRSVIANFDQDWVNNTGFDTLGHLDPGLSLKESLRAVRGLVATLREKNIRPGSVTIAGSPEYTYTDQVDDTTAELVGQLIKQGVVQEVALIKGTPSFSVNTSYLAGAISRFVRSNMESDPRLTQDLKTVNAFNRERVSIQMRSIDETRHETHSADAGRAIFIHNRALPSKYGDEEKHFEIARGDYHPFFDLCEAYGLVHVKEALLRLEALQLQEDTPPEQIRQAYTNFLEQLQPMVLP